MPDNKQSPQSSDGKVQIILGVLTLLTGLAAAAFPNWDKLFPPEPTPTASTSPAVTPSSTVSPSQTISPVVTSTPSSPPISSESPKPIEPSDNSSQPTPMPSSSPIPKSSPFPQLQPPLVGKPVLLGTPSIGKDYGQSKVACGLSGSVLTMQILERNGGYAMCCGDYSPPVPVKVGDKFAAEVDLEKPEHELDIKVETTGNSHILLHNKPLPRGKFSDKLAFTEVHFKGEKSAQITRFCMAAIGAGELQTVRARVDLVGKR